MAREEGGVVQVDPIEEELIAADEEGDALGPEPGDHGALSPVEGDRLGDVKAPPAATAGPIGEVVILPIARVKKGVEAAEFKKLLAGNETGPRLKEIGRDGAGGLKGLLDDHAAGPPGSHGAVVGAAVVPGQRQRSQGEEVLFGQTTPDLEQDGKKIGRQDQVVVKQEDPGSIGGADALIDGLGKADVPGQPEQPDRREAALGDVSRPILTGVVDQKDGDLAPGAADGGRDRAEATRQERPPVPVGDDDGG